MTADEEGFEYPQVDEKKCVYRTRAVQQQEYGIGKCGG
jgi:hypothetical protein